MGLGEIICLPDPVAAAERDNAMQADLAAGVAQPPRPLPRLGPGLHRDDTGGGLLSIQAEVDDGVQRGLFDDIVGPGGILLLADQQLSGILSPQDTTLLACLGWKVVALAADPGAGQVADTSGAYAAWLSEPRRGRRPDAPRPLPLRRRHQRRRHQSPARTPAIGAAGWPRRPVRERYRTCTDDHWKVGTP